MMRRLYAQFDHAMAQWKETLKEVERVGAEFWEVREFQRIPGVGPMAAHVFSAIIEDAGTLCHQAQALEIQSAGHH